MDRDVCYVKCFTKIDWKYRMDLVRLIMEKLKQLAINGNIININEA